MNTILIILGVAFGIAILLIVGASIVAFTSGLWRTTGAAEMPPVTDQDGSPPSAARPPEHSGRAYELVAHLPPNAEAFKCRNCGAIIDSTAELSAKGEVKCNYCNKWSSIYQ